MTNTRELSEEAQAHQPPDRSDEADLFRYLEGGRQEAPGRGGETKDASLMRTDALISPPSGE